MTLLSRFQIIRPRYETTQDKGLEWFIAAHIQAEKNKGISDFDLSVFSEKIKERIGRFCCKPEYISKRGHVLKDFLHQNWDEMELYRLNDSPMGKGLKARIDVYRSEVDAIFEQYYPASSKAPDDLIHVSCTGYVAPSGAQKIVSKNNWGSTTTVTHAYHMGCYGAMPAIRMAVGFLNSSRKKQRADIVHTEISCIHSNTAKHEADQLVTQSLFADGFIRYSVEKKSSEPHLQVVSVQEEIIPQSTEMMTWDLSDWNFEISLAKEVPVMIARSLGAFLKRLMKKTSIPKSYFAIHPGGPKIISQIQQLLKLEDRQIVHSKEILLHFGNMSSATLPHVWNSMLQDESVPDGSPIVSLAFGPGLSIVGSMMVKKCGS